MGFPQCRKIVRSLHARHEAIRVLVHNSWAVAVGQTAALRHRSATDPRLELIAGVVTAEEWAGMGDATAFDRALLTPSRSPGAGRW